MILMYWKKIQHGVHDKSRTIYVKLLQCKDSWRNQKPQVERRCMRSKANWEALFLVIDEWQVSDSSKDNFWRVQRLVFHSTLCARNTGGEALGPDFRKEHAIKTTPVPNKTRPNYWWRIRMKKFHQQSKAKWNTK